MEELVRQTPSLNLVGVCASATEALQCMTEAVVDLAFLDIEMPGMSGMQMLNYFNREQTQIVFVTSSEKHAVKAIDMEVTDYLLKPIDEKRFLKAILRVQKRKIKNAPESADLFVKSGTRFNRIPTRDILYVEGLANHVSIYTADGKRHIVLSTLKAIEGRLPGDRFMRIHNSYIVSVDRISAMEENAVIVEKSFLPVSRAHKKDLMARLRAI